MMLHMPLAMIAVAVDGGWAVVMVFNSIHPQSVATMMKPL